MSCPSCHTDFIRPEGFDHGILRCRNCGVNRYVCRHQAFNLRSHYLRHIGRFHQNISPSPPSSSIEASLDLVDDPHDGLESFLEEPDSVNIDSLLIEPSYRPTTPRDQVLFSILKARVDSHISWKKTCIWLQLLHSQNSLFPRTYLPVHHYALQLMSKVYQFEELYIQDPSRPGGRFLMNDLRVVIAHKTNKCHFGIYDGNLISELYHSKAFNQTQ